MCHVSCNRAQVFFEITDKFSDIFHSFFLFLGGLNQYLLQRSKKFTHFYLTPVASLINYDCYEQGLQNRKNRILKSICPLKIRSIFGILKNKITIVIKRINTRCSKSWNSLKEIQEIQQYLSIFLSLFSLT